MGKSTLEAWECKAQLSTILRNYEYKYAAGAPVSEEVVFIQWWGKTYQLGGMLSRSVQHKVCS